MGVRLPELVLHAKQILRRRYAGKHQPSSCGHPPAVADVPKGHFAVYVGDENENKRFVVPIWYLKNPLFQALLSQAEEEFGFDRPASGLMIPCTEDDFLHLSSRISRS
ncbi:hypothetical protein SLA2020_054740 [Shorea laevis]